MRVWKLFENILKTNTVNDIRPDSVDDKNEEQTFKKSNSDIENVTSDSLNTSDDNSIDDGNLDSDTLENQDQDTGGNLDAIGNDDLENSDDNRNFDTIGNDDSDDIDSESLENDGEFGENSQTGNSDLEIDLNGAFVDDENSSETEQSQSNGGSSEDTGNVDDSSLDSSMTDDSINSDDSDSDSESVSDICEDSDNQDASFDNSSDIDSGSYVNDDSIENDSELEQNGQGGTNDRLDSSQSSDFSIGDVSSGIEQSQGYGDSGKGTSNVDYNSLDSSTIGDSIDGNASNDGRENLDSQNETLDNSNSTNNESYTKDDSIGNDSEVGKKSQSDTTDITGSDLSFASTDNENSSETEQSQSNDGSGEDISDIDDNSLDYSMTSDFVGSNNSNCDSEEVDDDNKDLGIQSDIINNDSDVDSKIGTDTNVGCLEDASMNVDNADKTDKTDKLEYENQSSSDSTDTSYDGIDDVNTNDNANLINDELPSNSKLNKEDESDSSEKLDESHKRAFFDKIGELPSFKERQKGNGYAINTGDITVSDSTIRTLINKFLNQRFCKNTSDLNHRATSLEKTDGFYKWKVKDVIVHLETNQLTKVLTDKYGYDYQNGANQQIPLSFYFDLSGSMSRYSNLLSVIAIELLKRDVKVLVGFNEIVNVQIDEIDKNIDLSTLIEFLISAGYMDDEDDIKKNPKIKYKLVNKDIDSYLVSSKAEKCVVFADCDPIIQVTNLSNYAEVYWFCFEKNISSRDFSQFKGFMYQVQDEVTIQNGLVEVNTNSFKTLCKIKKRGGI